MGQSNSPSENYLFLNVMVNFVIVNQKLTGSALHIEKNQTIQSKDGTWVDTKVDGKMVRTVLHHREDWANKLQIAGHEHP